MIAREQEKKKQKTNNDSSKYLKYILERIRTSPEYTNTNTFIAKLFATNQIIQENNIYT